MALRNDSSRPGGLNDLLEFSRWMHPGPLVVYSSLHLIVVACLWLRLMNCGTYHHQLIMDGSVTDTKCVFCVMDKSMIISELLDPIIINFYDRYIVRIAMITKTFFAIDQGTNVPWSIPWSMVTIPILAWIGEKWHTPFSFRAPAFHNGWEVCVYHHRRWPLYVWYKFGQLRSSNPWVLQSRLRRADYAIYFAAHF